MSGDLSDEEDVLELTKDDRFDDETGDPEVIIRRPPGSDPAPSWCRELYQGTREL